MIKNTLYAKYIKEREGFEILEGDYSFCTYKIRDGELFIAHMYVEPEHRQKSLSRLMVDQLAIIAKENNCKAIVGTIDLRVGEPSNTLHAALKDGFKIYQANNDVILIGIDLKEDI